MEDRITIHKAENGFLVTPGLPEHGSVRTNSMFVFESYEALFEHIKTGYGPLVKYDGPEQT